jgi:hypothetical protein
MNPTHPSTALSPAAQRLQHRLMAGQHYEMLADLRDVCEELATLRFRTPSPEGWQPTHNGIPHPERPQFVYVYNESYGVLFAIYTEADWEDKKLWVDDWTGDFQYIRPRLGWASRNADGSLALLEPQPTHFFPAPAVPTT